MRETNITRSAVELAATINTMLDHGAKVTVEGPTDIADLFHLSLSNFLHSVDYTMRERERRKAGKERALAQYEAEERRNGGDR